MTFLPMVLLLLAQEPAPLAGTAVDHEGRPIAGLEIVLAWGQAPDGTVPILSRATTDPQGGYKIAVPTSDSRTTGRVAPILSTYRPGLGLVASVTRFKKADSGEFHLALLASGRRTFTLRGDQGRPLAGVRLAPLTVRPRQSGYLAVTLPDALADRMEVTTGPDGRAELACLEPTTALLAVRVTIPKLGTCGVALPEKQVKSEAVVLDLKLAGRMTGRVLRKDGAPALGAKVEIWSGARYAAPLRPVRFDAGPVRTGEDGTFHTPGALLAGVKYRALIRAEGLKPVLTEWVTPDGKAGGVVRLADVVLTPPRSIVGRVVDRQGRPVAGAEIVAGGESASALTDEQGKFRLDGLNPDHSFLVVRRDGFRMDGRLLGSGDTEAKFVLARFEEPAARSMTTLSSSIPLEQRRRLARRVLEPFLVKVLAKGKDSPKLWALRSLMVFDPAAALEALERTTFQNTEIYQSSLRRELSIRMALDDPEEAAAVAESIPQAFRRAEALVDVCVHLPDNQRARKRQIIDRVLLFARAEPVPKLRVWQLGEAAELLLDLGETERAQAVFAEGRPIAERLGPDASTYVGYFASRLGRVDLAAALALLGGLDQAENHVHPIGNLAARVAASNPAEAERLITKIRGLRESYGVTLRTCQNMAQADLPRARRIALNQEGARFRASALLFTAYGLPSSQRQAARDLVRQALTELDRARLQFDLNRPYLAAFMPWVESIDPGLVPEFFWRAVAELPAAGDPCVEYGRDVLYQALLLSRYDRQVASALFDPVARASAASRTDASQMIPHELSLLAVLDPHRAVAAVEAMPEASDLESHGENGLRIRLSEQLGSNDEMFWNRTWSIISGLGGVLGRRDVL